MTYQNTGRQQDQYLTPPKSINPADIAGPLFRSGDASPRRQGKSALSASADTGRWFASTAYPAVRNCLLLLAAVAVMALLIATPWLPYSPWNKPLSRYSIVQEPAPANASRTVPRIIHQTWKNEIIPDIWSQARAACQRLHPDYEFKLWTDASARKMIADSYPDYLAMYDGYKHNIQRADAMRIFFLHKFGGIYIDLDIECVRSLDFLRHYGWVMPQTEPVGFSNDLMVAEKEHPFVLQMMKALPAWKRSFGTKYPSVMFSTGPMFVSYQAAHYPRQKQLFVLPGCLYGKYAKCKNISLVRHLTGSTWHGNDASTLKWIFRHRLVLLGCLAAAAVLVLHMMGFAPWSPSKGLPKTH